MSTAAASVGIRDPQRDADADRTEKKDDPHHRSPAYAALASGYGALVGGIALAAWRTGRRPGRMSVGDFALVSVATFKLSRILTRDRVTEFLRAPFTTFERPAKGTEVIDKPVGQGMQRAVGELISCPFCTSQWVGTALIGGWLFAPDATRLIATGLAAITASDVLQYGHTALQQKIG